MPGPDPLLPTEEYYDYRGRVGTDDDAPPLWLPHHQGDVFGGVALPGVEQEEQRLAMLFQHPCTMRAGASLKPRVVMLHVKKQSSKLHSDPEHWVRKYSLIPLPGVLLDGQTYAGDLLSIATVDSSILDRKFRVATLSADGRAQYQQRVIHYLTRFCPSVAEVAESTVAVEAEITLQGAWVERAVQASPNMDPGGVIPEAEGAFDEFMADEGRRARLRDPSEQHRVNAEVHREMDDRYPNG